MSRTFSYQKFKISRIVFLTNKYHINNTEILKAIQIFVSAWNAVFTKTFVNFFPKGGISITNQEAAIVDAEISAWCLIGALRNLQLDLVPEDVNAASSTGVDGEVSAMQPPLADSQILAEFFESGNISDGYVEVMDVSDGLEEEPMECPWKSDLLLALEILQKFSLFSTYGEAVQADHLKIKQNTVKPLNSGHVRVWSKLSAFRKCLLFRDLVKIFNF